jgi:hypothetical protein
MVPVVLVLLFDFFFGGFVVSGAQASKNDARISHPIYHHSLKEDFIGRDRFGPVEYKLCTDGNGFKISCKKFPKTTKHFDIAFIGDSFTEGIGLSFEHSFVGQISKELKDKKIVNLAVASYSPAMYLSKVNFLLNNGFTFNEVVVYIDLSDILDENSYFLENNVVKEVNFVAGTNIFETRTFKQNLRKWFPLSYIGFDFLKQFFWGESKESIRNRAFEDPRANWTFNSTIQSNNSSEIEIGIERSLENMIKLSELLKKKKILLSVGVYPWPGQIFYDSTESKQVILWRNFCENRCKNFYNSFDSFLTLKKMQSPETIVRKYFIRRDVHFNREGSFIVAKDFVRTYVMKK